MGMKKFPVYQDDVEIGYLILESQVYYPYTLDGKSLTKGFFNKDHAEAYLKNFIKTENVSQDMTPSGTC
jgi:hypothetical protein